MADVAQDETHELISADKVEGTPVYNLARERLGTITNIMINKQSGQVEYAVLSYGGFLGIGEDHYPLPWERLQYSRDQGGYVVDIDKERLEGAPRYTRDTEPHYDAEYRNRVRTHYGVGARY